MSTRDLVDALASGDSIVIDNSFNAAMSEKISAALDNYRIQIAQNMFAAQEEPTVDVDPSEA